MKNLLLISSIVFIIITACKKDEQNTQNDLPRADFSLIPQRAEAGDPILFDAAIVSDKEDRLEDLQVCWSWEGNNTFTQYSLEKTATHTYNNVGVYFPKVVVKDTHSLTDTSKKMLIIVIDINNMPPEAPVQVSPPEWQTWMEPTITFSWKEANDPENDIVSYDLWVGPSITALIPVRKDITNFTMVGDEKLYESTETGFLYNHDYYWQVAAKDSNGNYSLSWVWKFTTKPQE